MCINSSEEDGGGGGGGGGMHAKMEDCELVTESDTNEELCQKVTEIGVAKCKHLLLIECNL